MGLITAVISKWWWPKNGISGYLATIMWNDVIFIDGNKSQVTLITMFTGYIIKVSMDKKGVFYGK